MNIRNYQPKDKSFLLDITMRAWEPVFREYELSISPDIYEIFVPDWQAEQTRSLNTICDSPDIEVFVAEDQGSILGFSSISLHPDDYLGQIYMLGVDPEYQSRGIGQMLMNESIARIKNHGFKLVMVETGGDPGHEPARRIYEKMGFELTPVARYLKRI